jgi:hypothetical protein
VIVRRGQIRAICRVFWNLKVQMLEGFNSSGASVCGNPMSCNTQTCFKVVLRICCQLLASDWHTSSHNNQHYLLSYISPVNMLVLAFVKS